MYLFVVCYMIVWRITTEGLLIKRVINPKAGLELPEPFKTASRRLLAPGRTQTIRYHWDVLIH